MSLLNDLFSTLDTRNLGQMASALGEADKPVSDGMRSAIATVLGGMASKASNPSLLRQALQLAPMPTDGISWANAPGAIADPASPVMSLGRRILTTIFGDSMGPVTRALGAATGLQAGKMSSLLAMAAPMVVSFLGNKVRDEGMTMTGLGNLLQREAPAIRAALPPGVSDLFWTREHEAVATSPVLAQTTTDVSSSRNWLLPLLLVALIPALFWAFRHGAKAPVRPLPTEVGRANRVVPEPPIETRTQPLKSVDLYFNTGSNKLLPASQAKLKEIVGALAADPSSQVAVNGYTDDVGSASANLQLSQRRASAVQADLVRMGIASNRVATAGYGEEDPIADNATAEGRANNRRVSVTMGAH